jgi:hypothetical protein
MPLTFTNRHVPGTTLVLFVAGGSNAKGNAAATGNPASVGYTMPAGCTLYDDSTTPLTTYPTAQHGPEVGILDELKTVRGFADPVVIVKHGVPGSSLANWNSIYAGEIIGYYGTSGRPLAGLFVHGANDATGGGAATYQANLLPWAALMRRERGAGTGIVLVRLKTASEIGEYPNTAAVQAAQDAFVAAGQGCTILDAADLEMRTVDSHFVSASVVTIGRRFVASLYSAGVLA